MHIVITYLSDTHRHYRKYKEDYNRDGGYWDEGGTWRAATGMYNEEGEFVPFDGYIDDDGNYKRFAKVEGTLSFMV